MNDEGRSKRDTCYSKLRVFNHNIAYYIDLGYVSISSSVLLGWHVDDEHGKKQGQENNIQDRVVFPGEK